MTTRYGQELARLPDVYDAARKSDVSVLARIVERHLDAPLIPVGSGGSFSVASFAAFLHVHFSGQVAKPATPLEYMAMPACRAGALCLTARGRNKDINAAFRTAATREDGPVSALVMARDTPLHALAERYKRTDLASQPGEVYRDGFLAVASLVGSAILLLRGYAAATGRDCGLPEDLPSFVGETVGSEGLAGVADASAAVLGLRTLSVLYTPCLQAGAVDIESRFVEAALGNVHIADFRNFGHGRHHWLAKHGDATGVLALVDDSMNEVAARTLELLPDALPRARIDVAGNPANRALASLLVGLYVGDAAGRAAGVDPGRPGIPEFGRRLYRLGPPRSPETSAAMDREAALRRKASYRELQDPRRRDDWERAHAAAVKRLSSALIGGVVADYDGTLCDGRRRLEPPSQAVGEAIGDLLTSGLKFGVATGRGPSAGAALRQVVPQTAWGDVVMGYYNGGVLTTLEDCSDPLVPEATDDEILRAIRSDDLFPEQAVRANAVQISIRLGDGVATEAALECARRAVARTGVDAHVTASSHSIDIVRGGRSKLAVVASVTRTLGEGAGSVLRIGDKGAWPGNDADFLDDPLGLSVDKVSRHRDHCWNLAPAGVLGVQAALYYLRGLVPYGRGARLVIRKRGARRTS